MIALYNKNGVKKIDILPAASSVYKHTLMTEEYVQLVFNAQTPLLAAGDYITYNGQKFKVIEVKNPTRTMNGYHYEQQFVASWMEWQHRIVFYNRGKGAEKSFQLTTTAGGFVDIIIGNLRTAGFGEYHCFVDEGITEVKSMSFDGMDIISALNAIAQAYETEWYIDEDYICIGNCEFGTTQQWTDGTEIRTITQNKSQNANYCTRLYAFGSTRNLPSDYRADETGVVSGVASNNLRLPAGTRYIDARANMATEEIVEATAIFEDVYPRMVGTITAIETKQYTDTNTDTGATTQVTAYRFKDSSLTFSESYVLSGEELRVKFQSGNLAGMDFALKFNPDGYDESSASAQIFEIVINEDYGISLPNTTYHPAVGDTYVLYNYDTQFVADNLVTQAENELLSVARAWLAQTIKDVSTYDCEMNEIACKTGDIVAYIGMPVQITSSIYGTIDSRIRGIEVRIDGRGRKYTIGKSAQYSRLASLTADVNNFVSAVAGGGGGVTQDEVRRIAEQVHQSHDGEYLHSQKADTAQENIKFIKGIYVGDYAGDDSILGSGGCMRMANGSSHTTTDFLVVRKKAVFTEIEVHELKAVGGEIVLSPAAMVCNGVTELTNGYKCFFKNKEEDENGSTKQIYNEFRVGDLARCQTFNFDPDKGSARVKYYWRAVTEVGEDYIVLSKTDCDTDSDVPESGDNIVSLGNKTDSERQSAIILSAVGEDAPSTKHYNGINSYALRADNCTFKISSKGNKLTGLVEFTEGSKGAEYLNIKAGGDNLILNSGFRGSVESVSIAGTDSMGNDITEMYSPKFDGWQHYGADIKASDAAVIESKSGYYCKIDDGYIEQTIGNIFVGSDYVLSLRGNGNIIFSWAGVTQTITFAGERTAIRFKAVSNNTAFRLSGTGYVCEMMLERGIVASNEWTASSLDRNPDMEQFTEYDYLRSALVGGKTSILGGLVLSNVIQVGNYVNGEMTSVTGGISGIYNTDDDVAIWGGGTLAQAMRAVRMFKDNPQYQPTAEEWAEVANAVITHGGRAILNDAIFKGSVYADNGYFKGDVYANNGIFNGEVHATSGTFTGQVNATSGTFTGSVYATDGEFHGKIAVEGGLILSTKTIKVSTDKWLAGDCFLFVSIDSKTGFSDDGDGYPIIYFPDNPNEGSQYNVISNSAVGTIRLKLSSSELAKGVRILDLRVQESIAMDMPERTTFVYSNNYWIVVNKYR